MHEAYHSLATLRKTGQSAALRLRPWDQVGGRWRDIAHFAIRNRPNRLLGPLHQISLHNRWHFSAGISDSHRDLHLQMAEKRRQER